jgi:hypothetical protein
VNRLILEAIAFLLQREIARIKREPASTIKDRMAAEHLLGRVEYHIAAGEEKAVKP